MPVYDLRSHWLLRNEAEPWLYPALFLGAPITTLALFTHCAKGLDERNEYALPNWREGAAKAIARWCGDAVALALAPAFLAAGLSNFAAEWASPWASSHGVRLGLVLNHAFWPMLILGAILAWCRRLAVRFATTGMPTPEVFLVAPILLWAGCFFLFLDD
jgi:hypothetical protein